MSDAVQAKFSLRVRIDKQKAKVLYAEVGSDFMDVLLSFLLLPLGRILKILENHYANNVPVIGSLTTMFNGLKTRNNAQRWTQIGAELLLNPRSASEGLCDDLKVNFHDTPPKQRQLEEGHNGGLTVTTSSYIITDGLLVVPNGELSIMETLGKLGIDIKELRGTESKNVIFGFDELLNIETRLENIDNFYRFVGNLRALYIKGPNIKEWLLNPPLARSYASTHFLGLCVGESLDSRPFVEGPCSFMVEDDLTVKPLDFTSWVSALEQMGIDLEDVIEEEIHIKKNEALCILDASLKSKTALTDGLISSTHK